MSIDVMRLLQLAAHRAPAIATVQVGVHTGRRPLPAEQAAQGDRGAGGARQAGDPGHRAAGRVAGHARRSAASTTTATRCGCSRRRRCRGSPPAAPLAEAAAVAADATATVIAAVDGIAIATETVIGIAAIASARPGRPRRPRGTRQPVLAAVGLIATWRAGSVSDRRWASLRSLTLRARHYHRISLIGSSPVGRRKHRAQQKRPRDRIPRNVISHVPWILPSPSGSPV